MLSVRRRGFTLIELLVVIAIIGILAAMLFPVFARARESARKTQCLANVKNIAMAFQIYLTDFDKFPPSEQGAGKTWFNELGSADGCCCHATGSNPYLRAPVVMDEYTKSREVWNCPSAHYLASYTINPCPNGDWLSAVKAGLDQYGQCSPVCNWAFPPGWGGSVTDTFAQGACAGSISSNGFHWAIGVPRRNYDLSTSAINDSAKRVVCADGGVDLETLRTSRFAYPDMMGVEKALCKYPVADWANCPDSIQCGAGDKRFQTDVQYRKDHAFARHMGGSNMGFADGHAKWFPSETILFGGEENSSYAKPSQVLFEGIDVCGFGPAG